jgi:hypothetical protein
MPADDLILNVRQIAGYPFRGPVAPQDAILLQLNGLGGPYAFTYAEELVSTALASAGSLAVGEGIPADANEGMIFSGPLSISYDSGIYWNAYPAGDDANYRSTGNAGALGFDPVLGWEFSFVPFGQAGTPVPPWQRTLRLTTGGDVLVEYGSVFVANDWPPAPNALVSANYVAATTVASFNGRNGAVCLEPDDIVNAGGALLWSPQFYGCPTAWTPDFPDNSTRLATTAFVWEVIAEQVRTGRNFVTSFNGRRGAVTLTVADIVAAGGASVICPTFLYSPSATTPPVDDNSTLLATTEWVNAAIAENAENFQTQLDSLQTQINDLGATYAPLASPQFTGFPAAPTAPSGTTTGQLATTAFVMNAVAESTAGVASFNGRTGLVELEDTDITTAGGALLDSPAFTGQPTAPTAAPGAANTLIATTAFVAAAIAAMGSGVSSFNGRTGAITLALADVTGAGGAPLASPGFTGGPTAPTPATGDNSTLLATTAFVMNTVQAIDAGVVTFNGRSGAVTLNASDISAAGGALLASPAFTGAPTAPTAAPGASSAQLATTAFVMAAILAGGGVSTFNGRAGAVTLTANDVSAAGGPYQTVANSTYRNRIINGDMAVDQLNGGLQVAFPTVGTYALDRWGFSNPSAIASKGAIGQIQFGTPTEGFPYALNYAPSVAYPTPVAADGVRFYQAIENINFEDALWGTANAQPITVQFWVRVGIAGTYAFSVQNYAGTRSYVFTQALPANTFTLVRVDIPGDTQSGWTGVASAGALILGFTLCAGSTFTTATTNAWLAGNFFNATGAVNVFASTANGYTLMGVGLMVGAAAQAGAQPAFKSFADNLIDCQRYYEKSYPYAVVAGTPGSVTAPGMVMIFSQGFSGALPVAGGMSVNFKTIKRATPTLNLFSAVSGAFGVMRDRVNNVDVAVSPTPIIGDANFTAWASMSAAGTAVNLGFQWAAGAEL